MKKAEIRTMIDYLTLNPKTDKEILRLLTHVGVFWKTWSDTFRSVLIYKKEQESPKKYFITVENSSSSWEALTVGTRFLDIEKSNSKSLFSRRLKNEKKIQNLEAKKSALLWLKSHNFSET